MHQGHPHIGGVNLLRAPEKNPAALLEKVESKKGDSRGQSFAHIEMPTVKLCHEKDAKSSTGVLYKMNDKAKSIFMGLSGFVGKL